jgi:hypothetical protein
MQLASKKIYKYRLTSNPLFAERLSIQMPATAKVIHTGFDPNNALCLWAEVDPTEDVVEHTFETVWTGGDVPEDALAYLGMVTSGGAIVIHVYKIYKEQADEHV